ncbi:MAG: hypothetical protein AAF561_03415 [Planctomycetota bacterium]
MIEPRESLAEARRGEGAKSREAETDEGSESSFVCFLTVFIFCAALLLCSSVDLARPKVQLFLVDSLDQLTPAVALGLATPLRKVAELQSITRMVLSPSSSMS